MALKVTQIKYRLDGTAEVQIATNMSEDDKYTWIECMDGNPYYTGWDFDETGMQVDFDASLCYSIEQFKDQKEYLAALKSDIRGAFRVTLAKNVVMVENLEKRRGE
jgi:hypothetical protein